MSTELDTLSAGDIQPYQEGMPVLAPLSQSPDTWGNNDLLREDHSHQSQGPTLFGSPLPAGTSRQQAEQMLGQLGGAFMHDLSSLGYNGAHINAAISFMTANALKAPFHVVPKHNFNLHGQDDYLGHAFGNMVQGLAGSPRAKQMFVTACLQWLYKVGQQLAGQSVAVSQTPRTAPLNPKDPTADLTDQQYNQLVAHNNAVKAQTMATLERKWGSCFKVNIELAQAQLNKQTPAELDHLDRYTGSWPWTHMFNTVECLTAMYDMAIGANSIGTSGAEIAKEISQFEAMLKIPSERAKYMRDPQLQARLRELYSRRG